MQNIRNYDDTYNDKEGYMVAVYLRSDKFYDSYERNVDDLLTVMGDVGGLNEALCSIGMLLVGFFSSRQFMSKIVRKIYHIRKYDNIDHETKLRINADGQPIDGFEGDNERF